MIYNKTLHPDDYEKLTLARYLEFVNTFLGKRGSRFRFEHEHRKWEYALGLHLAVEHGCKSILDVGGGSSIFAPAATILGFNVTQVDPRRDRGWVAQQSKAIGRRINYTQEDFFKYKPVTQFDCVACISVIEHVPEHKKFFEKLLTCVTPGGVLYLTTDYHESGGRIVRGHLRTANTRLLLQYADIAIATGFTRYVSDLGWDYLDGGTYVNGYNFAAMALRNRG